MMKCANNRSISSTASPPLEAMPQAGHTLPHERGKPLCRKIPFLQGINVQVTFEPFAGLLKTEVLL